MEVVVSMGLLSVLLLVVTMLYLFGLRSSSQSYRQMEQLATVQAVSSLLTGELEPAAAKGTSTTPSGDILSLLSGNSPQHLLELDPAGHVVWQKYVLYAFNSATRELRRFEHILPAGTTFSDGPVPLETLSSQPLTDFVGSAQPNRLLANHVLSFKAEKVSFRLMNVKLIVQQPGKPEQSLECSWRIHN